jgi:high-affinity Fe2+/Pb2+ permease
MRSIAEIVSEVFIWGVGITRPKPGKERAAALFITLTLAGTVVAVVLAFLLLVRVL